MRKLLIFSILCLLHLDIITSARPGYKKNGQLIGRVQDKVRYPHYQGSQYSNYRYNGHVKRVRNNKKKRNFNDEKISKGLKDLKKLVGFGLG